MKHLKEFEQEMLIEKSHIVKEQNRDYYRSKCLDLIDNAEHDSFCRAAANIMLNSGSEYLADLEQKYRGKMDCQDMNFLNEPIIKVDEKQVNELIENICNQEKPCYSEKPKPEKGHDLTPDQKQAIEGYEIHTRGLETSGMTMDKENIQINKPMKRGRPKQKTTQFIIDENQEAKKPQKEKREPFRPIEND